MSTPQYNVGILGATGAVGQTFIRLLDDHPWFTVTALAASERSAGKSYREAANWLSGKPMPDAVADLVVQETDPSALDCDFVFSGLSSSVAGDVEKAFAEAGFPVISNAKNYRMHEDVPLLIPEVNADHARLVENQSWRDSGGFIVTNPNCSTVGLVCALRPLVSEFGVDRVQVTMLQALSGAGYPGVPSLDALGNVIPYIGGEEEKLSTEPRKILGTFSEGRIHPASMTVSAQCNRVPVREGHMACISVACDQPVSVADVKSALEGYQSPLTSEDLPSVPESFLRVMTEVDAPQPLRHVKNGGGMTVSIGRIQDCPVNHVKFVALSHNTIRGAAGGAVLNAELLARDGYLTQSEDAALAR